MMVEVKRPTRSKYMGHVFKIKYIPSVVDEENSDLNGQTDKENQVIEICSTITPSKERETILHEMSHQLFSSGLTLPESLEEPVCEYLGCALAAHIEANPGFWAYITRKLIKGA